MARPRTSDAPREGGTAAAAAAEEAVTTTMMTKVTRGRRAQKQRQSTIGHSWISTAFAICLDFNIDLTVSQTTVVAVGQIERKREKCLFL